MTFPIFLDAVTSLPAFPKTTQTVFIAARGSVAARVARTVHALGWRAVGVFVPMDRDSTWVQCLDDALEISSYTDIASLVNCAQRLGSDMVHPGVGFVAEDPYFALLVNEAGMTWLGPSASALSLCSDKASLASLAQECGLPVPAWKGPFSSLSDAVSAAQSIGFPCALKRVRGGGGRGVSMVNSPDDMALAWQAMGLNEEPSDGALVQQALPDCRHIEVQICVDGTGSVLSAGTRECSVQRRWQKIMECAPAPCLSSAFVTRLEQAAAQLVTAAGLCGVATVEFLVPVVSEESSAHPCKTNLFDNTANISGTGDGVRFASITPSETLENAYSLREQVPQHTTPHSDFMVLEVNARLQVEHGVTEEVTGIDLVALQCAISQGHTLCELFPHIDRDIDSDASLYHLENHGVAVEGRIYSEDPLTLVPSSGVIGHRHWPESIDELLAVNTNFNQSVDKYRELTGVKSNSHESARRPQSSDRLRIDSACRPQSSDRLRIDSALSPGDRIRSDFSDPLALFICWAPNRERAWDLLAAICDRTVVCGVDSLAPLVSWLAEHRDVRSGRVTPSWLMHSGLRAFHDAEGITPRFDVEPEANLKHTLASTTPAPLSPPTPLAPVKVQAPIDGIVVARSIQGELVRKGDILGVIEAMKMRLTLAAPCDGWCTHPFPEVGSTVKTGDVMASISPVSPDTLPGKDTNHSKHVAPRPQGATASYASSSPRPQHTSARKKAHDLVDEGTLSGVVDDDSVLTAYARINGIPVALWIQDPTFQGGTIGLRGSRRVARLIAHAADKNWPVVSVLDGGGARIDEGTDALSGVGLILSAIAHASSILHIAVVTGAAAGGAAYAPALADVVVMVEDNSSMFLTGPAVLSRATGEKVSAQELGGVPVHAQSAGTCHLRAHSDTHAWSLVRDLVNFAPLGGNRFRFIPSSASADVMVTDSAICCVVPDDRSVPYDVHSVISSLCDRGDFTQLRPEFVPAMVTGFGHIGGVAVGIVAPNPGVGAGAIVPEASDKAADHVRLCSDLGLPLLTIVDTPGFMPGVTAESGGAIRHGARLVEAYALSSSRLITLLTGKAYGGAFVALGSAALSNSHVLAWPSSRVGVMDAASAVRVTQRKYLSHLAHTEGDDATQRAEAQAIAEYASRESPDVSVKLGWIDEVIDPSQTRSRLRSLLRQGWKGAVVGRGRHPGDGWLGCSCGATHWGLNGAAGILVWRRVSSGVEVLLQLRAQWTHHGGTWGIPGGAICDGESALEGALRECSEETGINRADLVVGPCHRQDHGDWSYSTFVAEHVGDSDAALSLPGDGESSALAWVRLCPDSEGCYWQEPSEPLIPAMSAVWDELAALLPQPNDQAFSAS
ncbi:carboxyl transferase domain-containing protein [Actinomyces vulturis]|uniref:carboxyl transferase domain-containing protein n=1 Tax=Actinomyces vulturis TaxID=1857645 RepID=UPI00159EC656|nr:carboxyl transferase domain-containing protein [Actinomyces vulturis]